MTTSSGQPRRTLWGVEVTGQAVALLLCALVVGGLIALAALDWLEHFA